MKILIVEDESNLSESIAIYLKHEGYLCEIANTFSEALEKIDIYDYDCIVLDISLPDGNGLQVLKALREDGKTDGVIITSAKNSVDDKISGLRLGADDYLAKPFHLSELSARISAVIRRRKFGGDYKIFGNEITIDTNAKLVYVSDTVIELTHKEYDLLLYFLVNKNRVLSKNAIAEHLCIQDIDVYDNFDFIYTHVKNLKRKLSAAGAGNYLKSIYGMGYKFEVK
ncbi:MAG: response regulator transcription factor [Ferruginibacter sp.]